MPNTYLGFDFGYKRIGVAVGQSLTCSASPLQTVHAKEGQPQWEKIDHLIRHWQPQGLIVGVPVTLDDQPQYTTKAAIQFAESLKNRYTLPVYQVDERLSTKEARAIMFEKGGYKKIKKAPIDSIAACIILEQWLRQPS